MSFQAQLEKYLLINLLLCINHMIDREINQEKNQVIIAHNMRLILKIKKSYLKKTRIRKNFENLNYSFTKSYLFKIMYNDLYSNYLYYSMNGGVPTSIPFFWPIPPSTGLDSGHLVSDRKGPRKPAAGRP